MDKLTSNQKDKTQRNALLDAIHVNDLPKIQELVSGGLSVNKHLKIIDGEWVRYYTPLCVAIAYGNLQVMQYFIQQGAQVNKASFCTRRDYHEKFTPLFMACKEGQLQFVQILINSGSDVNQPLSGPKIQEEEGGTMDFSDTKNRCLHWATTYRKYSLLQMLLDCGADPLIQNSHQETPLHLACDTYNPEMIKLLVKAGGVASNKDMYGATPFANLLSYKGEVREQMKLIKLILSAGYNTSKETWLAEYRSQRHIQPDNNRWHGSPFLEDVIAKFGDSFLDWLLQWNCVPQRLTYLCRVVVRQNIGSMMLIAKIRQLPLPLPLIHYLTLDVVEMNH